MQNFLAPVHRIDMLMSHSLNLTTFTGLLLLFHLQYYKNKHKNNFISRYHDSQICVKNEKRASQNRLLQQLSNYRDTFLG